jgi:hypothetical protein
MATYQTYQEVGIKEDVSDIITNISPRKTPFLSSIGNEKITQPLFQWQEDSLRAVQGTGNAIVEGADATFITVSPTVMRNNYSQIFLEAVQVSQTTEVTLTHGRAREMAYQMSKSAAALKRDLENALVGTAQSSAVGNATTARTMAGFHTQVVGAGTSTFASQSGNVWFMGAATNLSEAVLVSAIQSVFVAGADATRILVTPTNSIIVAAFASAAGRYRTIPTELKGANQTIVNAVNLYVSPFGEQKVEIDRFLRANSTLVYEPDMWTLATLRPWSRETLAKTGDSTKQMLVGEYSLKHKNYAASAIVVDNKAGAAF